MSTDRRPLRTSKARFLTAVLIVLLLSIASTNAAAGKGENPGKGPSKPKTITFDAPFPRVESIVTCSLGPDGCPSKSKASISTSGAFVLFAILEPTLETPRFIDAFAKFRVPLSHTATTAHSKVEWLVTLPIELARANASTVGLPATAFVGAEFVITSAACGTTCPTANVVVRQVQAVVGEARDEGSSLVELHAVLAASSGTKLAAGAYNFTVIVTARAESAATIDSAVDVGVAQAYADGRLDSVRMTIYP